MAGYDVKWDEETADVSTVYSLGYEIAGEQVRTWDRLYAS